jgi:hypothetical protein
MFALAAMFATPAWPAAKSGFGIQIGYASHTSSGEITEGALTGAEFEVTSSGTSIGIDYQLALSDSISISPFLISSAESAESDELIVDTSGHGILGIQIRFWLDTVFIGGHVGSYSEVLSGDAGDESGRGTGYGVVIGWESRDSGLFLSLQSDQAKIEYSDAESDLTGARAHIGWRFK